VNGPVRLHSEYILLADIVLATPSAVFQDKPHFELGVASGDGVHLLWQEAIGTIRGRYFILARQELDAQTAKDWGAVNEIIPADKLLPRAREIAEGLAKLPPLTTKYTRIAMSQKLRRIIDEGAHSGSHWKESAQPMLPERVRLEWEERQGSNGGSERFRGRCRHRVGAELRQ